MDTCAECGFTYGALPRHLLASHLVEWAEAYVPRLASDSERLRRRRLPEQWSPLEYACHVRDMAFMQRDRLYVALVEESPSFKPMYRDERVAFDRYNLQSPAAVGDQLKLASALLSGAFSGLSDDQWVRPVIFGYPAPEGHDVEWVAHHSLHEMVHHLADIDRILSLPD